MKGLGMATGRRSGGESFGLSLEPRGPKIPTKILTADNLETGIVGLAALCNIDGKIVVVGSPKAVRDIICPDSAKAIVTKLAESPYSGDFYNAPAIQGSLVSGVFWLSVANGCVFLAGTEKALKNVDPDEVSAILEKKVEVLFTRPPSVIGF